MKTRSLLTLVFAVAAASAGAVWIKSLEPPASPTGSLQFLSAAPALPIFDRAGKETNLAKENDNLLVVHFWATWCPPCVEEIPALSKFWDQYKDRGDLSLYAISVDKDWKTIDAFLAKHPSGIPMYHDPDAATAKRFGTSQYPETYIVNRSGRVLFRLQGAVDWNDPELKARIEQILAS
jgi:thiol-disulfide isomerase/thioredoxin